MATDWTAARLDYVAHSELTYADIARKYGGHESHIRRRAARERWTEERNRRATIMVQDAAKKIAYSQSEELARCNADDLRIARKLKDVVEKRLKQASDIPHHALRSLEAVAEGAQRIARLALGAPTENVHTDPYAEMTDQELAAELSRIESVQ